MEVVREWKCTELHLKLGNYSNTLVNNSSIQEPRRYLKFWMQRMLKCRNVT
jgi:hypothetical protein